MKADFISVFGFEGRYFVNSEGIVITYRFNAQKVMKPTIERGGSHSITLWGNSRGKIKLSVARVVAESFGLIPPGIYEQYRILRKNGKTEDNTLANLVVRVHPEADLEACSVPLRALYQDSVLYCDVCRQLKCAKDFTYSLTNVTEFSSPCLDCNNAYKNSPVSRYRSKKARTSGRLKPLPQKSLDELYEEARRYKEYEDWSVPQGSKYAFLFWKLHSQGQKSRRHHFQRL